PDYLLVPVGLGSGICGAGLVAAARNPATRLIGVQAELAPAVTLSWRQGRPVETGTPQTFAEGMATRISAEMTLALMRRLVHDMVLLSEEELRAAIRLLLRVTHNLAEGAGAASTAAAFKLRDQLHGKTVAGLVADFVFHRRVGVVDDFEVDLLRLGSAEHLHGVVFSALLTVGDGDAGLGDIGIKHVLAVAGRLFPALDESLGQRFRGEAFRIK